MQQLCKSCRTCFKFYCMFYFTCDRSFRVSLSDVAADWHEPLRPKTVTRLLQITMGLVYSLWQLAPISVSISNEFRSSGRYSRKVLEGERNTIEKSVSATLGQYYLHPPDGALLSIVRSHGRQLPGSSIDPPNNHGALPSILTSFPRFSVPPQTIFGHCIRTFVQFMRVFIEFWKLPVRG